MRPTHEVRGAEAPRTHCLLMPQEDFLMMVWNFSSTMTNLLVRTYYLDRLRPHPSFLSVGCQSP